MRRSTMRVLLLASWLLCGIAATGRAETVVKIDLGNDSAADLQLSGGVFSTRDQLNALTSGQQDTSIIFSDVLDAQHPDIVTGDGSFTLAGVTVSGSPATLGTTVFQPTVGGTFQIYNTANQLVLSGTLVDGTLTGPIGASSTGSFLTAAFGTFTGGTLAPFLDPNSMSLAISLTNVLSDGGQRGLRIVSNALAGFSADATANIGAYQAVPEPMAAGAWIGGWVLLLACRRPR